MTTEDSGLQEAAADKACPFCGNFPIPASQSKFAIIGDYVKCDADCPLLGVRFKRKEWNQRAPSVPDVPPSPAAVTGEWTDLFSLGGNNDVRLYAQDDQKSPQYLVYLQDGERHAQRFIDAANHEIRRTFAQLTARAEAAEAKHLRLNRLSNQLYTELREHRPLSNKGTGIVDEVQHLITSIDVLRQQLAKLKHSQEAWNELAELLGVEEVLADTATIWGCFKSAQAKLKALEEKDAG